MLTSFRGFQEKRKYKALTIMHAAMFECIHGQTAAVSQAAQVATLFPCPSERLVMYHTNRTALCWALLGTHHLISLGLYCLKLDRA